MKAAIAELRNSVSVQQNNMSQNPVTLESNVSTGKPVVGFNIRARGRGTGRGGRGGRVIAGRRTLHSNDTSAHSSKSSEPCHKNKAEGARRVWGTFSVCTASAMQNTIKKLCGIDSVRVKRKTKELANGKMYWWFVLHDEEVKLQAIDAKWEQVEFQTTWKLEPCFRRASTPVSQPLSRPEHGDSTLEPATTLVPTHSQSPLPTAEATPDVAGDAGHETLF